MGFLAKQANYRRVKLDDIEDLKISFDKEAAIHAMEIRSKWTNSSREVYYAVVRATIEPSSYNGIKEY